VTLTITDDTFAQCYNSFFVLRLKISKCVFPGKPLQPILMSPRVEHLKGASVALPANFRLDWMERLASNKQSRLLRKFIFTGLWHWAKNTIIPSYLCSFSTKKHIPSLPPLISYNGFILVYKKCQALSRY
jgi:hypothetical protein